VRNAETVRASERLAGTLTTARRKETPDGFHIEQRKVCETRRMAEVVL
jgi:hypothetical protein